MKLTPLILILFFILSLGGHSQDQRKKILVKNSQELVEALGSDRIIELTADTFRFSSPGNKLSPENLSLRSVRNLEIRGMSNIRLSKIHCGDQFTNIVSVFDCENITFTNLEFNHRPKAEGPCEGGVLHLQKCKNISINNCQLIGSGAFGMVIHEVENLQCTGSKIHECSSVLLDIENSANLQFNESNFTGTRGQAHLVFTMNTKTVSFKSCHFSGNWCDRKYKYYNADQEMMFCFYKDSTSTNFSIEKSNFSDNDFTKFTNRPEIFKNKSNQFKSSPELNK